MARAWKPVLWFSHEEVAPGLDQISMLFGSGSPTEGKALMDRKYQYRIIWDGPEDAWRLDIRADA